MERMNINGDKMNCLNWELCILNIACIYLLQYLVLDEIVQEPDIVVSLNELVYCCISLLHKHSTIHSNNFVS